MNKAVVNMVHAYLLRTLLSISVCIYKEVELLDHLIILFNFLFFIC